jgi:hypothetical protein
MADQVPPASDSFWGFITHVLDKHGAVALVLVLMCFLFWRLIWKVWSATLKSKDAEIERLVTERDKYQGYFFEKLESSRFLPGKPEPRNEGDPQ